MRSCVITLLLFLQIHCGYAEEPDFKYQLSVVSLFRNEARFLKEWIEYHLMLGVDHFYLYNHLSEDDFLPVLQPYIDKGIVELENIVKEPQSYAGWFQLQTSALNRTIKKSRNITKWLAIIDSDEFIVPMKEKNIKKFLEPFEEYGGVIINWVMFGTSDIWEIPADQLMIENLVYRAPDDYELHTHIKTIVQPLKTKGVRNAHYCQYLSPYFCVNSNKTPSKEIYTGWDKVKVIALDAVGLFHYWTRDEKFLWEEKIERQQGRWKKRKEKECLKRATQINEVYDGHMLKYVKKLKARMALLKPKI